RRRRGGGERGDPRRGESGGRHPVRLWGGRAGPVSEEGPWRWHGEPARSATHIPPPQGDTSVCCPIRLSFVEKHCLNSTTVFTRDRSVTFGDDIRAVRNATLPITQSDHRLGNRGILIPLFLLLWPFLLVLY